MGALCRCGQWEFRDITVTTALAALERWCPKCRTRVLLVFRRAEHVATVAIQGAHERHVRTSLVAAGLNGSEVGLLMEVVGEIAS